MLKVDCRPGGLALDVRRFLAEGDPMHLEDVAVLCDHNVCLDRVALFGDHHWLEKIIPDC